MYYLFRFLQQSFNDALEHCGLIQRLEYHPDTLVTAILRDVQAGLETGPHEYQFTNRGSRAANSEARIAPGEALALTTLALVNRGRPRADGHIRLVPQPCQRMTLREVLANTAQFAHPLLCVEGAYFVLHVGK